MELLEQKIDDLANDELREKFENRALQLKTEANLILVLITLLLVSGVAIFFLAAKITSFDISVSDISIKSADLLIKEKQNRYKDIEEKVVFIKKTIAPKIREINTRFNEKNSALNNKKDKMARTCVYTGYNKNTNQTDKTRDEYPSKKLIEYTIKTGISTIFFSTQKLADDCLSLLQTMLGKQMEDLNKSRIERDSRIKTLNSQITPLIEPLKNERINLNKDIDILKGLGSLSKKMENNFGILALIQINITRFGSLLIIFFLANILLLQYRYIIKLSVYYDARADALSLGDGKLTVDSLPILLDALTPNVDFGKSPQTPIKELIEILKMLKDVKNE